MNRRFKQMLLRAASLVVLLCAMLILLSACGAGEARVVFNNQSRCGAIAISLTEDTSGIALATRVNLPMGEAKAYVVKPDVLYRYEADFTAGGTQPDKSRCTAVESGTVRVPAGSAQNFNLESEVTGGQQATGTP